MTRLAWLSLLAAALMPIVTFACLWPLVSPMPVWDQWSVVEVWDAHYGGRPVWPLLLKNYNGHWNCLPRMSFYVLGLLTRWDLRAEVFLNYGALLLTQLLLLRMLYEARPRLLILAAPVSAHLYSFVAHENLLSGYPFTGLLAQLCATAAIYALTRWPARSVDILYGTGWALAALFSNSIAVAVAPAYLLANLALAPRNPWRWLGWSLVTVVAVALAVFGASHAGVTRPPWARLVPFALVALGHPFSWRPVPAVVTAQLMGAAAVVSLALLVYWRWRSVPAAFLVRWAGLGLFSCAAAMLVAFGRGAAGAAHALASHYVSHTSGLALATLVLAGDAVEERLHGVAVGRTRLLAAGLLALLCGGVMLQTAHASYTWLRVLHAWSGVLASLNPKVADGSATDAEIHQAFHPDASLVRWGVGRLRKHRLAWFKAGAPTPAGTGTDPAIPAGNRHADLAGTAAATRAILAPLPP
jgi:hypothetical protein